MQRSVIFQSPLATFPNSPQIQGSVRENTLCWQENGRPQHIALQDVVGVSVINQTGAPFPGLIVHAYPVTKNSKLNKSSRKLREYYFSCSNLEDRSQWQRAINHTLVGQPIEAKVKPRHLEIIINPVSGKKQALEIFEQVRPLFDRSFVTYRVTLTLNREDTSKLTQNLDLAQVDSLVIVGGDGTIHDAIAGLMSRPDWERAIQLPLGIIPGGTGNGLSKSLLALAQESYTPLNAAFLIAKGQIQALDLAKVRQNNTEYYSLLSLAWGLISDVDIESEKFKFLGALRFDLYALWLILCRRTYRGKISFIPHDDCNHLPPPHSDRQGAWYVIEDEFIFIWGMNVPWAAHDMNVTPYAQLNDGSIDILMMRQGTSRLEILQALLRCGKGEHLDLPHLEYYKARALRLEPLTNQGLIVVDGELVDYTPIEIEVIPSLARINC